MLFHRRIRFLLSSALLPAHLRSAVPLPVLPGLRSASAFPSELGSRSAPEFLLEPALWSESVLYLVPG